MRQHSLLLTLHQEVESKGYEKKEKRGEQNKTPVRQKISLVKV
jgi:hypothetical protein